MPSDVMHAHPRLEDGALATTIGLALEHVEAVTLWRILVADRLGHDLMRRCGRGVALSGE